MNTQSTNRAGVVALLLTMVFSGQALAQNTDSGPALASPGDTPEAFDNPELVQQYQASITADDLASHLYFFASDFFEGRETATRGQKMAAEYLAAQYRKMGLKPMGTGADHDAMGPAPYLQPFPLYGSRIASAELTVAANGSVVSRSVYSADGSDGNSFLWTGESPQVSGAVTFAGYGIADDELGYNDYAAMEQAGIDPTTGWMMILDHEPLAAPDKSLLPTEDGAASSWTTSRFDKIRGMMNSLPVGVLIVSDRSPRDDASFEARVKAAASGLDGVGRLSLEPPSGEAAPRGRRPPMYRISSELADAILAPSGKTIASLQQEINSGLKPVVFSVSDVRVSSKITKETFETSSENVVAYIEGSDPDLKDEFVVVSSHYDHIGISSGTDGDVINNGADDDGSGTVAVLEIAEAFVKARDAGVGPRRSILFLNVSGEEKGLLGSAYYTDSEPIVPLEKTVTNLNIDMIGRVDPTHPGADDYYVYIIGSNLISQELHDINARVNDLTDINLDLNERFNSKDDPNQFYRRSDHWNFGKHSVPFIFFFTGTHDDYHGVDDEADKIEYARLARISQLIFATAWQVANQDAPPAVSGEGFN